jgi:hypothetical protein
MNILSPYQKPGYTAINVVVNGSSVVETARKGRRAVRAVLSV